MIDAPSTLHTDSWIQRVQTLQESNSFAMDLAQAISGIANYNPKFNVGHFFFEEFLTDKELIRLQNRIFKPIRTAHLEEFVRTLSKEDKARIDSARGNGEDSSGWLETTPHEEALTLSDNAFVYASRYRCGTSFPEISDNHDHICIACQGLIDVQGHHLCGACTKKNMRKATHDNIVNCLIKILYRAGRRAYTGKPLPVDRTIPTSNHKFLQADIDVFHNGKKDLLDVTIVDRLLPFYNLNVKPKKDGDPIKDTPAHTREMTKINKNRNNGYISGPNGDVVPIAIETLGKFGEIGYKYICKVAESFDKGFKRSTVKKYWFRKLSVTLQNSIGVSVQEKIIHQISGNCNNLEELQEHEQSLQRVEIGPKRSSLHKGLREGKS